MTREREFLTREDGDLLGRRLSAWLAMHRVTPCELATQLGLSRSGLSRAMHGARPFPVTLALQISAHTGLSINGNSVTFDPARAMRTPEGCDYAEAGQPGACSAAG